MKNIVILGSTGSIGESALRVVSALSERLRVVAIAVEKNYQRALEQARDFKISHIAVSDPMAAEECRKVAPQNMTIHAGSEGVEAVASLGDVDVALCAVVGMAGLKPVLAAIDNGIDVALATKEVLVAAGHLVTRVCEKNKVKLLPVDSEHSAIFQCIADQESRKGIRRLLLTASGGPFAGDPELDLATVSVEQALNHPRWSMGPKVTIDSATLMNKGLEIIEAHWLFDVPVDRVEVVLHPESIVHSMVEFADGNIMAQLSPPDMRFAIQYALTYPERIDGELPSLDLAKLGALTFGTPDSQRFPCLGLAREAATRGGTLPAVMNAANEIAVQKFLDETLSFPHIWQLVEAVMARHDNKNDPSLADVLAADDWARKTAAEISETL